MPSNKKLLQAAAGNAGESLYVEDVFSTYLYDGNGSTNVITNGIDLDGEGGLVWVKSRDTDYDHAAYDTEGGVTKNLYPNLTNGRGTESGVTAFNSNGFTLGSWGPNNNSANDFASWSFRKAEKFFDVQTYTGTGSTRTVAHNLGSTPGFIIIKRTSLAEDWTCWHIGVPGAANYIQLNKSDAYSSNSSVFNNTAPTDSVFTVGSSDRTNTSGESYVAYLFASDAGGFGDDGSENIIKCGSYVGTGSATVPNHVELGFEPQYWLFKNTTRAADWWCIDTMRGADYSGTARLFPNTAGAEVAAGLNVVPTATGFDLYNNNDSHNRSGDTYIYIAIRRPMKTPESGTEVFDFISRTGTGAAATVASPILTDALLTVRPSGNEARYFFDRPRGGPKYLNTTSNVAEGSSSNAITEFGNDYIKLGGGLGATNGNGSNYLYYLFQRATGFFDVVAYNGNGTAGTTQAHNLGVAPKMMIVKVRNIEEPWAVYHTGLNDGVTPQNYHIRLTNGAEAADSDIWNNTAPTSSVFTTGGNDKVNANGGTYIAYLFATLAGVSKVGSYTGTGSDLNVDCGFSAGARFILIKRSDSTGDWYVWDSERGIVAGNDPYLLLNTVSAEVTNTDYIDPLSSGFTVTSSAPAALNASGGNYIFLAIA